VWTHPAARRWEYTYDALGNRISVEHNGVVTQYLHDPIGLVDVAAEYDGGGALAARYIHGLGLAARVDAGGQSAYYAFDATGNTRQLSNASGTVVNSYDYDPFGIPLQTSETIQNPFRYVGRYGVLEEQNDLTSMRTRFYSKSAGRFVSVDPIGYAKNANLYLYTNNNPIAYVDPLGLYTFDFRWGVDWPIGTFIQQGKSWTLDQGSQWNWHLEASPMPMYKAVLNSVIPIGLLTWVKAGTAVHHLQV